jgi:hypothetical protein
MEAVAPDDLRAVKCTVRLTRLEALFLLTRLLRHTLLICLDKSHSQACNPRLSIASEARFRRSVCVFPRIAVARQGKHCLGRRPNAAREATASPVLAT